MADRMPPPGLTIVVAHPKEGGPGKRMEPPTGDEPKGDGKSSPEEAGVVRADEHCVDCAHYDPTSGDCAKVSGSFDPQDACMQYFEKIGADEPDADEEGGPPDEDADDMAGAQ